MRRDLLAGAMHRRPAGEAEAEGEGRMTARATNFRLEMSPSHNNGKPGGHEYWILRAEGHETRYLFATQEAAFDYIRLLSHDHSGERKRTRPLFPHRERSGVVRKPIPPTADRT
jgi:hypothetical protein